MRLSWLGLVVVLLLWPSGAATRAAASEDVSRAADTTARLDWHATTLDGRRVTRLDVGPPVTVRGDRPVAVALTVRNNSLKPLRVSEVRLTGRVAGVRLFDYGTELGNTVEPFDTLTRTVDIDLPGLSRKGLGLVSAELTLVTAEGDVLGGYSFPARMEGAVASTYGLFGLGVAGTTVVLLAALVMMVRRGMLPEDRWRRAGLYFLPVGIGLGLTSGFLLSLTGLAAPGAVLWAGLVLACAAVTSVLGYFWTDVAAVLSRRLTEARSAARRAIRTP